MDFINIIGTIFDNSINHVVALAHLIRDIRLNKNQQEINEDIYNEIDNLKNSTEKCKGYFESIEELRTAIPSPEVGDWAIVGLNICKCNITGTWTQTLEQYSSEINLSDYAKKSEFKTINNESIIGLGNINIELDIVSPTNNGLMSSDLYSDLIRIKNEVIPEIRNDINNILTLFNETPEEIDSILTKFNQISETIANIESTEDGEVLGQLLLDVSNLREAITSETNRAIGEENNINTRISNIKSNGGIKHIFLTQDLYDSLINYELDTLYFIIGNQIPSYNSVSRFGDSFPFILGISSSRFGDTFPLTFNN